MMRQTPNSALLNRSAFVNRPYRSTAVSILTTLFHRFTEAGDFTVIAQQQGGESLRLPVRVLPESGPLTRNLDLANPQGEQTPGCCPDDRAIELQKGGILGFYVSEGNAAFAVRIQAMGATEKQTLLDSQKNLPQGDLYAVTLVRPGDYRVTNSLNQAQMWVRVQMPTAPEKPANADVRQEGARRPASSYTPAQPSLVHVSHSGFDPKEARLFAGQTLVFLLDADASLSVELESVDDPGQPRRRINRKE